jgi:hypothetical protein
VIILATTEKYTINLDPTNNLSTPHLYRKHNAQSGYNMKKKKARKRNILVMHRNNNKLTQMHFFKMIIVIILSKDNGDIKRYFALFITMGRPLISCY